MHRRFLVRLTFLLACAAGAALLPSPAHAQGFGGALALDEQNLLVGELRNQTLAGVVYAYRRTADGWTEVDRLQVTEALRNPDGFGRSMALFEGTLLVGAPLLDDGAGGAVVYGLDGDRWVERQRLSASDGSAAQRLGSLVALSEGHAVLSAPQAAEGAGAVYVYPRTTAGWGTPQRIPAPANAQAGFGAQMALSGDHLLVATAGPRGAAADVYAYHRGADGNWAPAGTLAPEALGERSSYGTTLAVSGDAAWVGAPGADQRIGQVVPFTWADGAWEAGAPLGPMVRAPNARFGTSLAAEGTTLLVGTPGGGEAGAIYQIERSAEGRVTTVRIADGSGAGPGAGAGGAVAAAGDVVVTGALSLDEGQGAALVLERGAAGWADVATLVNEPRGFESLTGEEIHCQEGQAALFDCQDVNITAFLPIHELGGQRGTRVNDIWGWTDPESGIEYAIVGRTNGTSFVDLSDPYNPVYVGDLPKTEGSRTTIWRDMKVYQDHVYIVADAAGEHGVQVFDLRQLRDYRGEPLNFEETYRYDGIHSAHNIVINEETGFAYAVGNSGGGETCGGGLHMINLEDPARPVFAGCYQDMGTGRRGTGYAHDAQCVVYRGPDMDHQGKEICLGSNETALSIADVTDKSAPVTIASASYPSVVYAHQGWLTEDHTFFYMNDEGDEPQGLVEGTRTLVWDVTDLDDPILVKEHIASTTATDHNLYVKGDRMYQSNYSAGFRVLDVSNPADPVEIGFLDTSPYEGGASWSNYPFFESGIIAVTGTGDGLFLVRDMARRNLIP